MRPRKVDTLRKVVLDTNVYIDWLNDGVHLEHMTGRGLVRYMSAVVHMELGVGAKTASARRVLEQLMRPYRLNDRLLVPDAGVFDQAGKLLRTLRAKGREISRASLVNDVLIALSARAVGAAVVTGDEDFAAIHDVLDFKLELIAPSR